MAKCAVCQLNVMEESHKDVLSIEEIRQLLSRLEEEKEEEEAES